MGKRKLKTVRFATVVNESDPIEEQKKKIAEQIAEILIEEGFIAFDFRGNEQISSFRFVDAMVCAVKLI